MSHRLLKDEKFTSLLKKICDMTRNYFARIAQIDEHFGDQHRARIRKQREDFRYWKESRRIAGKHRGLAAWLRKKCGEIGSYFFAAEILGLQY
jgi:hypothetical protein